VLVAVGASLGDGKAVALASPVGVREGNASFEEVGTISDGVMSASGMIVAVLGMGVSLIGIVGVTLSGSFPSGMA
jgi:hypothetical protein